MSQRVGLGKIGQQHASMGARTALPSAKWESFGLRKRNGTRLIKPAWLVLNYTRPSHASVTDLGELMCSSLLRHLGKRQISPALYLVSLMCSAASETSMKPDALPDE